VIRSSVYIGRAIKQHIAKTDLIRSNYYQALYALIFHCHFILLLLFKRWPT